MRVILLLSISVWLTACANPNCIDVTDENHIPPYFPFTADSCNFVANQPDHPYHSNKWVISGCNQMFEHEKELDMFENSKETE